MAAKMRVTKGKNWDQVKRDNRCVACNGSGWYDSTDSKGRPIPCGACEGTGQNS